MDRESVAGAGDTGEENAQSVAGRGPVAGLGDPGRLGTDETERPKSSTSAIGATETAATTADAPGSIDLNALHKMSPEELVELAKKFGVSFHAARTRHFQILDIARAALGAGTGHVLSTHIIKGSGDASFDQAALAMMRRADPVPQPPPLVADEGLNFTLPVIFRVKKRH